ncbi:MAG: choice-of-anchor X domain-containing protein [Ignavibacteriaceae bacterium]
MRIYYLLLILLLIWGCEQTFDNVIDTTTENYQLSSVIGIKDTIDLKEPGDSLLSLRLIFTPQSEINKVYFDIYASDNTRLNSAPVEMQEVLDKIYEEQFILERENPIGIYNVRFSVIGLDGKNKQVAVGSFYFNNGQDNVPPVVSNLVMPDTVLAGETIIFTVEVSDSNGLNDVKFVFYEAYNPDGIRVENSEGIFEFPMFDDGNTFENGDVTAGDGIYTVILTFPVTAQIGTWRFEFQARDRSNTISNKIIHNIVVQ